jgi:hypothetical protein
MAEITNKHHEPEADNSSHVSHERSDIDIFQIAIYGVGLVVSCLIAVVLVWGIFSFLAKREDRVNPGNQPAMIRNRTQVPPEPRLSGVRSGGSTELPVGPHVEMQELRDSEAAILDNYGWVDAANGTARVPIEVAIDMVAKKGLPSSPSAAGADGGFRMIPSDASSGKTLEKISQ